MKQDFSKIKLY